MDIASFHKTPAVLSKLKKKGITTSLIPGGCTGLLQPLDTAVNKPFKQYLQDYTEQYMDERPDIETWSVSDKRIMVTHVVARAWCAFCLEKRALIQKSFLDVGLTLPVDGSQDYKLKIKGMGKIEIGDWQQDLAVPVCYQEGQEYRVLPLLAEETGELGLPVQESSPSGPEPEFFEFFWQCEDYYHEQLVTPTDNDGLAPGGNLLSF